MRNCIRVKGPTCASSKLQVFVLDEVTHPKHLLQCIELPSSIELNDKKNNCRLRSYAQHCINDSLDVADGDSARKVLERTWATGIYKPLQKLRKQQIVRQRVIFKMQISANGC